MFHQDGWRTFILLWWYAKNLSTYAHVCIWDMCMEIFHQDGRKESMSNIFFGKTAEEFVTKTHVWDIRRGLHDILHPTVAHNFVYFSRLTWGLKWCFQLVNIRSPNAPCYKLTNIILVTWCLFLSAGRHNGRSICWWCMWGWDGSNAWS